jgi:hypothetical protein
VHRVRNRSTRLSDPLAYQIRYTFIPLYFYTSVWEGSHLAKGSLGLEGGVT